MPTASGRLALPGLAGLLLGACGQESAAIAPATGIGGATATATLGADLLLTASDGRGALVRGPLLTFASPGSSDLSVLGRDVIDLCDLVYLRRSGTIALLTPPDGFVRP